MRASTFVMLLGAVLVLLFTGINLAADLKLYGQAGALAAAGALLLAALASEFEE